MVHDPIFKSVQAVIIPAVHICIHPLDKLCAVVPLFLIIGSFPFASKIGEIQRRKAFKIGRYLRSLS